MAGVSEVVAQAMRYAGCPKSSAVCVGWTMGARPRRAENRSSARRSGRGLDMSSRLLSEWRHSCWGAWQAWQAQSLQTTFEQALP